MRQILFIAISLLSGCASLGSQPDFGATSTESFGAYSLPKALVPIEVIASDAGVSVLAREPILTPDADQTFRLQYSPSALAGDDLKIEVDPSTGFLKTSTIITQDQTAQIVTDLAKGFTGLAESQPTTGSDPLQTAGAEMIARLFLDPGANTDSVRAKINEQLTAYKQHALASGKCKSNPKSKDQIKPAICTLDLTPDMVFLETPKMTRAPLAGAARCQKGLCYRQNRPQSLQLRAPNGKLVETVLLIPNGAPIESVAISRSAFVKKETTTTFENGFLISHQVKKPSEAAELAKLPFSAGKAALSAVGEVVQLKLDVTNKEKELITAEKEKLNAQAEAAKAAQALKDEKSKTPKAESTPTPGKGAVILLSTPFGLSYGALPRAVTNNAAAKPTDAAKPGKEPEANSGEADSQ